MPKIKELTSQSFIKLLKICISEREKTHPEPETIMNEIEKLINEKGSISKELIKKLKNNFEISTNTINSIITLEKNINNLDSTNEPQNTGEKTINSNSKKISKNNIPDKKEEKQIENEVKNDINNNNIEKQNDEQEIKGLVITFFKVLIKKLKMKII
jgi:plasmid maintenance system antidote protein VapI